MFIGYSSITKGQRIYRPVAKKVIVSIDVRFDKSVVWNWKKSEVEHKVAYIESRIDEESIDDASVRGTRSLSDIYASCNVVMREPADYKDVASEPKWV